MVQGVPNLEVNSTGLLHIKLDTGDDSVRLTDRGGTVASGNRITGTINGRNLSWSGVKAIRIDDAGSTATGRNEINYTARTNTPVGGLVFLGGVAPQGHAINNGTDIVTVNLAGLARNRPMDILLFGQGGSDTLQVNVTNPDPAVSRHYQTGSRLNINILGGLGWDAVGVNAWSSVRTDVGSQMNVRLAGNTMDPNVGGDADNNVAFWALGRMDGNITFDLAGSNGNDWVSASLFFNQGSAATVGDGTQSGARIHGGAGNDTMDYLMRGGSASPLVTLRNGIADGGDHAPNPTNTDGDLLFIARDPVPTFLIGSFERRNFGRIEPIA